MNATPFRLYWLGLNAAYVMEFFLQTLVKRRYITQGRMLRMNQFLMLVSTTPRWRCCAASPCPGPSSASRLTLPG